jgi:hypothetical protein
MALSNATFSDLGGAVSDLFSAQAMRTKAQGDIIEGKEYGLAAELAGKNEQYTELSTAIKEAQESRKIYQTDSGVAANMAQAGFGASGSALDIMRDSAAQGALAKATLSEQGLITEAGYKEQQQSYLDMQQAANMAADSENKTAMGLDITVGIKGIASIATLLI